MHIYHEISIARNVRHIGPQHMDEGEALEVHLLPEKDVLALLTRGEFVQALHACTLWKYFWLSNNKTQ